MLTCKVCEKRFIQNYLETCCSKECSGILRNPRVLRLRNWIKNSNIDFSILVNQNFSAGMIFDLLVRDYFLPKEFTLRQIRDFLNSKFKFNTKVYNKQPQWWKLQFKYPKSFTKEEILKDIHKKCIIGANKTHEIREKKGNIGNLKFKREDSPLCLEFYVKRNIPEALAKEKIAEIALAGAFGTLKNKDNKFEKRIEQEIKSFGLAFERQYKILLLDEEKRYNKKSYIFDFYIPEKNLLIETQGIFWHASPAVYKTGDRIKLPRFGLIEVEKIWKMDEWKKQIALKRGFNFKEIWENESFKLG